MSTANARSKRPLLKSVVFLGAAAVVAALTMAQVAAQVCTGTAISWIRQFGIAGVHDQAWGTAVDAAGNVYAAGNTGGTLPGQSSAGGSDAFVRKYDSTGAEMWTSQFGTIGEDWAWDVAVDGASNVYVAGYIAGAGHEALLRKYDSAGTEVWTRQFGTLGDDEARGAAVDAAGNIYVAGYTGATLPGEISAGGVDAFVRKYDSSGIVMWTHQFGSPAEDVVWNIASDAAGNTYVAGYARGALPGQTWAGDADVFLRKYDAVGTEVWTRQFGTSFDDGSQDAGVDVDQFGNVFLSGMTDGALPGQTSAFSSDAFLRKYDSSGTEVWTHQFGTPTGCIGCGFGYDQARGVTADAAGNAYLTGTVGGTLPGQTWAGALDAFVRKYDSAGSMVWTRQFGSSTSDYGRDVAVGEDGKLYVAGFTYGTLTDETHFGDNDAFVVELTPGADVEPPSLSVVLSPNVLWPPDHRMVAISASVQASDACDSSPIVSLVSVTSNEPDNGDADGDTIDDIQIVGNTFLVRAERSAAGTGRIYTVTYVATDVSGNTSPPVSATVRVPLTIK